MQPPGLAAIYNRLLSSNTTRNVQTRLPHPFLLAGSSVLQVASSYNPGLVVTRRANDLWKLYGVAVYTRGPAKLETSRTSRPKPCIVSPPADCIRQQPHLVYSTAAAVPRTTTVQLSQSPSPAQAAQAAQAAHHVVLDENSAEWRQQSR